MPAAPTLTTDAQTWASSPTEAWVLWDHPAPPPRPSDGVPAAVALGASSPINASSVAGAWEGGPGKALGPSQPGPLSGWHGLASALGSGS